MALYPDAFSWGGGRRGYLESKCLTVPAVFAFVLKARRKGSPLAFQSASPLNLNSENTNAEWLECVAFKEIFLSALKAMKYMSLTPKCIR